jgi:hypothetical protein
MKKNLTLLFISIVFSIYCRAQRENNIWYFGNHAGVDFNSGIPVALSGGATSQYEGCSSVSDSAGNLLFYTDGVTVWNRNHAPMSNGSGLSGDYSSSQSAMIVKQPGNQYIYYIFTVMADYCYSVVDMTLNGGLGDVTAAKNVMIQSGIDAEKQCATSHANGVDVWIVMHALNNFYAYTLTPAGFNSVPVISTLGLSDVYNYGQMKMSQRGNRIAFGFYAGAQGIPDICVLDFDYSTGVVTNNIDIPNGSNQCYGLEFSPDGTKLYASAHPSSQLLQYDLSAGTAAAIVASQVVLPVSGNMDVGMQLGPDGKIYVTKYGASYLAVINNPNLPGLSCNYVSNAVSLGTGVCQIGLPELFIPHKTALGINNNCAGSSLFSVYPNPCSANEELTISFPVCYGSDATNIIIYNINGKQVAQYHQKEYSSTEKIKLPKLAAGVYVARLVGDGVGEMVKFVVN